MFNAEGAVPPIAVSDDRQLVMAATEDNTVLLWDLSPPSSHALPSWFPPRPNPRVLRGSGLRITAMVIAADQRLVVFADEGGHLFIWQGRADSAVPEVSKVTVPLRLRSLIPTSAIALGLDGQSVFSSSGPKNLDVWTLDTRQLIALARQTAGRNLTFAEWKEFFPGESYRPTFPDLPVPPFDRARGYRPQPERVGVGKLLSGPTAPCPLQGTSGPSRPETLTGPSQDHCHHDLGGSRHTWFIRKNPRG